MKQNCLQVINLQKCWFLEQYSTLLVISNRFTSPWGGPFRPQAILSLSTFLIQTSFHHFPKVLVGFREGDHSKVRSSPQGCESKFWNKKWWKRPPSIFGVVYCSCQFQSFGVSRHTPITTSTTTSLCSSSCGENVPDNLAAWTENENLENFVFFWRINTSWWFQLILKIDHFPR